MLWSVALLLGIFLARVFYASGTIGYSDDWNVPSSPHGLWVWGLSDLAPWRPIEYGMPLAYPTDLYLKLGMGILGLLGVPSHLVIAFLVSGCIAVGFVGLLRLTEKLWSAPLTLRVPAALLYVTSPALFDALVPGYITFLVSYALLPWLGCALLDALRGRKNAWYAYAFFLALSLTQIQFIIFDAAISMGLLIALRVPLLEWMKVGVFGACALVSGYLFIIVNALGGASLVAKTIHLSQHSWTALSAPGILGAFMLLPSVYPYFDQSLGSSNLLWRLIAVVLVSGALFLGFRSDARPARVLFAMLVLCLIFLNGTAAPFGGAMRWLLDLPAMALVRNVNYVFALVALLLSVLLAVPASEHWWERTLRPFALWACAFVWAWPFWSGAYGAWIAPIAGPNTTTPIVGADGRILVLPHLQVIDKRRETRGGVNPNSVETVTPIFVRETSTGSLEASILDRLTDWMPRADTLTGALRAAHLNGIALQTHLESKFPQYVNSYQDPWLTDAYETQSIGRRLNEYSGVAPTTIDDTVLYQTDAASSDVQTADSAVAVDGSVEHEIALRSMGVGGIFLPVDQVEDPLPSWVHGIVRQVGAPPLLTTAADVHEGADIAAGLATEHHTADFHRDWVDIMASANWWLTENLLGVPHAAITDKVGGTLRVSVPSGRRRLWIEYYVSRFGGSIALSGAIAPTTLVTRNASLGEYRWADMGETDGSSPFLTITSQDGFNGVGRLLMVSEGEEARDRARFARAARGGRIELVPNLTFDESLPLIDDAKDWKPSVVLANPFPAPRIDAMLQVARTGNACTILIGSVRLADFQVSVDGRPTSLGAGRFLPLQSLPCDARDAILVNGVRMSAQPLLFHDLSTSLQISSVSAADGGMAAERTIPLSLLPLGFPSLQSGRHLLAIHPVPLFPAPGAKWSEIEDAEVNNTPHFNIASGGVREEGGIAKLDFYTTHHAVDSHVALRPLSGEEQWLLVGSYSASKGTLVRILLHGARGSVQSFDLPADGTTRDFHLPLTLRKNHRAEKLYVYLFPQGLQRSEAHLTLSAAPITSADLVLWDSRFHPSAVNQSGTGDISFQRYAVDRPQEVLEYDQTYDEGWGISEPASHYVSSAGFNLWAFEHPPKPLLIFYKTGVPYAVAVALSSIFMLWLGIAAIRQRNAPRA